MEPTEQVLVAYNCPRLIHDVLVQTLSSYGWRVNSSREPIADSVRIKLALACLPTRAEDILKTVERIHAEHPGIKIILLGAELTDNEVLQLIRSGVGAYVDTNQGLGDLLETLKMMKENRSPSRSRLTSLVLNDISRFADPAGLNSSRQLTYRENQVLGLLTKGCSNKEIAQGLSITLNTVKNHVHNVLEKLNVKSRHEAAWITSRSYGDYKKAS